METIIEDEIGTPIMVNAIIRCDTEKVLFVSVPVPADRIEIEWSNALIDVPDVQSQLVSVQVFFKNEDIKNVCRIVVCYNVDRVITTMQTEREQNNKDIAFGSPYCLSQMKKVERHDNMADDRNSCTGADKYYNKIINEKQSKRMRC